MNLVPTLYLLVSPNTVWLRSCPTKCEALPVGWGKRGRRVIISDEQGDKGQILRGTKTILRNREHEKTNVQFLGEQGNKPIYFRGTREQVPPPPPPPPWYGLKFMWHSDDIHENILNRWFWLNSADWRQQILIKIICLKKEPFHEILVLIAYTSSEGSDEPAHPSCLARAFVPLAQKGGMQKSYFSRMWYVPTYHELAIRLSQGILVPLK